MSFRNTYTLFLSRRPIPAEKNGIRPTSPHDTTTAKQQFDALVQEFIEHVNRELDRRDRGQNEVEIPIPLKFGSASFDQQQQMKNVYHGQGWQQIDFVRDGGMVRMYRTFLVP